MKRVELFVRHDAELDALGYFHFLLERNPEAAFRFLDAVDATIEGLAVQPLKGRQRKFRAKDLKNIRSWRVDNFENYLIFYRLVGTRLEIIHIKHGAMAFPKALRKSQDLGSR